jgi:hypothetical protein
LQPAPTRKSTACFGAVGLGAGHFERMMCALFNAATFRTFHNRCIATLPELLKAVNACFGRGRGPKTRCADYAALLRTLCFN